jgi:ankyrin repeat protein
MDARFRPAAAAIKAGDLDCLRSLLAADPSLATARSGCSHPTLLQCLAVDAGEAPNQVEMVEALIEAGAAIDEPLVAAASMDNAVAAAALLDAGAAIDGRGGWSPLEEALYWSNQQVIELLLARGAAIQNLRVAAGLGRTDLIEGFFEADGTLKPAAVGIAWPFGDGLTSNHPSPVKTALKANIDGWDRTPQGVLNNAFVYACMHHRLQAAELLLEQGAEINTVPPGFDFAGTGLHYAALNGHREMVDFLLARGADPTLRDPKVGSTPAGWAAHAGHQELAQYLECVAAVWG